MQTIINTTTAAIEPELRWVLVELRWVLFEHDCSICLDKIGWDLSMTKCGHTYHEKCLGDWMNENHTCPLCRTALREEDPEDEEDEDEDEDEENIVIVMDGAFGEAYDLLRATLSRYGVAEADMDVDEEEDDEENSVIMSSIVFKMLVMTEVLKYFNNGMFSMVG